MVISSILLDTLLRSGTIIDQVRLSLTWDLLGIIRQFGNSGWPFNGISLQGSSLPAQAGLALPVPFGNLPPEVYSDIDSIADTMIAQTNRKLGSDKMGVRRSSLQSSPRRTSSQESREKVRSRSPRDRTSDPKRKASLTQRFASLPLLGMIHLAHLRRNPCLL